MLHWKKLWAATALCMVPALWQVYQSLYLGHSASFWSLGDILGPASVSEAKSCGCASCIVELSSSAWFKERYNSVINPLLTVHTSKVAPDVLSWWLVSYRVTAIKPIQAPPAVAAGGRAHPWAPQSLVARAKQRPGAWHHGMGGYQT